MGILGNAMRWRLYLARGACGAIEEVRRGVWLLQNFEKVHRGMQHQCVLFLCMSLCDAAPGAIRQKNASAAINYYTTYEDKEKT